MVTPLLSGVMCDMWILTRAHFGDRGQFCCCDQEQFCLASWDCNVDVKSLDGLLYEQIVQIVRKTMPIAIRLYDENDVVLYSGYTSSIDEERDYEPLYWAMSKYECTEMRHYDPDTERWEL